MNDTHRSTPAFAVAGKVEGPTALHTQTTAPDAGKGQESVTLWREVDALEGAAWDDGSRWALREVFAILKRRGFTEHADAPAAGMGQDSGKFGAVASNGAGMGDDAPEPRKTPVWPEIDRSTPAGEARYQLTLSADVLIRHAHEAGPLTIADMIRCHNTMLEASSLIAELIEPTWKGIPLAETDALVLGIDGAVGDGATSGITDAVQAALSGDHTPEQLDRDPSRWTPAGAAWLEAGAPVGVAYAEYRGDAARVTHELGAVTRDTLDPTAAEQRANLERIAGTPRPTAAEMKFILERMAEHERRFYALGYTGQAADCAMAATMLDRLGVEVLNLDLIVEDQQRQLARIAANAKPLDGLEVARLVQQARMIAERMESQRGNRGTAEVLHKLIAALNDQARQVADGARFAKLVSRIADWTGDEVDRADALQVRHVARVVRDGANPEYPPFDNIGKPRCRIVTSPRFYGEADRNRARDAVFGRYYDPSKPAAQRVTATTGDIVDTVATALGMRRAEA